MSVIFIYYFCLGNMFVDLKKFIFQFIGSEKYLFPVEFTNNHMWWLRSMHRELYQTPYEFNKLQKSK